MNQVLKAIKERRSIRKYKPDMIDRQLIDQVIEAGLYAASGMGKQSPKIIAVTNKEMRDEIAEDNRQIGGWKEGFDPFYGAPVILIVIAPKDFSNSVYDGSLVLGNMMLAAHSLNLGSIWINRAKQEFERPIGDKILSQLGIEGEWIGIGHCALGYIEGEYPDMKPRKDNRVYYID